MIPALAVRLLVAAAMLAAAAPAAAQSTTSFGNELGALRQPEALAVAPDGTLLVGDHLSGRVQVFRDGRPAGSFGMYGETCGRFGAVGGIAVAPDGRAYVFDTDNQRVHVFDADRTGVRCFGRSGNAPGQFRTSSGAYAASTGTGGIAIAGRYVYVADTRNDRIQRFTLDGRSPKVIGKGRLDDPQGVSVRGGRLLVADDRNHRVVEFTTGGRFVRASGAGLRFPYDVAVAPDGRTYVADNNGHRVVVLDRRLRPIRSWGRFGRSPGRLIYPRALALAPNGRVFVADPGNDRVTEFTAQGRYVRTLGTNGRRGGMLSAPQDVAVNGRGEVAVADGNLRISWHDLSGRYLGRWGQGRSFRQSTAVLSAPRALTFAEDARVRIVDGGSVRDFAPGVARSVLAPRRGEDGAFVRALDLDAAGTTWVVEGRGRLAALGRDGALGTPVGPPAPLDRVHTAVAALGDGTFAIAQAHADNRANPADGLILRVDATGKQLSSWPLERPPGGEATAPMGLAADGAGGVWVSDAANARVLHLSGAGSVVATLGAAGTGPGGLARPAGLALDCAGGLLVADPGNNRVVRFGGVREAPGCAPAPAKPTATARMPRPVGVRTRVRERAPRPAARVAVVDVLCDRPCRVTASATLSPFVPRRLPRQIPLKARVAGRRIVVTGGERALRAWRSARREGGHATAAILIDATASDGVVDTTGSTITLR